MYCSVLIVRFLLVNSPELSGIYSLVKVLLRAVTCLSCKPFEEQTLFSALVQVVFPLPNLASHCINLSEYLSSVDFLFKCHRYTLYFT